MWLIHCVPGIRLFCVCGGERELGISIPRLIIVSDMKSWRIWGSQGKSRQLKGGGGDKGLRAAVVFPTDAASNAVLKCTSCTSALPPPSLTILCFPHHSHGTVICPGTLARDPVIIPEVQGKIQWGSHTISLNIYVIHQIKSVIS